MSAAMEKADTALSIDPIMRLLSSEKVNTPTMTWKYWEKK
jgi:hypothetical protein